MAFTPEKLGLHEIKYLTVLDEVLAEYNYFMAAKEFKEEIVLAHGQRIKKEILRLQSEGEVKNESDQL